MTYSMPEVNIQQRYIDYIDYLYKIKSIPQQYAGDMYGPAMEDAMVLIKSNVNGNLIQQVRYMVLFMSTFNFSVIYIVFTLKLSFLKP